VPSSSISTIFTTSVTTSVKTSATTSATSVTSVTSATSATSATSVTSVTSATTSITSTSTSTAVPSITSTSTAVPSVFIEDVLNGHNDERMLTSLKNLTWSDEMYKSSKDWSDNLASRGCVLEHFLDNANRQNLYGIYGTVDASVSRAIEMWIDEKNYLDKPGVTFEEIGHYLNIVSLDIGEVGCAISGDNVRNCAVVTCNYK
jgi:uncharacterized protein YkwD